MIMNLFSVFVPTSSLLSVPINWLLSVGFGMLFIPMSYWTLPSRGRMLFQLILDNLSKEIKTLVPNKSLFLSLVFVSLILMILMNNALGLLSLELLPPEDNYPSSTITPEDYYPGGQLPPVGQKK